jgi:3',5'-cyclic AMP phosphodiesterase CpdA
MHVPDLLAHGSDTVAPWQQASRWPDRIVATFDDNPATSFAVTWRTSEAVTQTIAQIAVASADARFDRTATTVRARTERLDLNNVNIDGVSHRTYWNAHIPPAHFHSVSFRDLKLNTQYAYRVRGDRGAWSEWFQLRTADPKGPVRFVYLGDAQNAVLSHWSRVMRAAFTELPKADFVLHAGDLVNRASRDLEWAEWFKAVGFIHGMIPAIPVAGNHEYERLVNDQKQSERLLSAVWRPQFTLPVDPDINPILKETVYDIRYSQDVHIFVLASQQESLIEEQGQWLDKKLAASDARWRVVSFHHPIYSSGTGRDSPKRREALLPVLLKHEVDLVLQGHDHTYARGDIKPQTPERFGSGASGDSVATMFVNSVSGPKQYKFKDNRWDDYADTGVELKRFAENTQFFQIIEIDGERLTYKAYTALGDVYDEFVMTKDDKGRKQMLKGKTSTMEERRYDNTGDYGGVNDLM